MSEAHAPPKHPYHLVAPSIWPLFGALAAGLITTGGVLYMHGYGWTLLIIGALAVLALWTYGFRAAPVHVHFEIFMLSILSSAAAVPFALIAALAAFNLALWTVAAIALAAFTLFLIVVIGAALLEALLNA